MQIVSYKGDVNKYRRDGFIYMRYGMVPCICDMVWCCVYVIWYGAVCMRYGMVLCICDMIWCCVYVMYIWVVCNKAQCTRIGMEFKHQMQGKKSTSRSVNRSQSGSKGKRGVSPTMTRKAQPIAVTPDLGRFTKKGGQKLVKRRIEDIKSPDLLIKINYKGKVISLPIFDCTQGLHETVMPHIIRFESEVLHNTSFTQSTISNWRTVNNHILTDYYIQTNHPLDIFKGQKLVIEPIWHRKVKNIGLKDFQIIKCIGTGGFSRVFLARFHPTGAFYALKLIEKEGLTENGKECVVINQREILSKLTSPFTLKLQFAFETKHFVVFALQYCAGGELFYYLRRTGRMNESDARYCFVQILLGLQDLHTQEIIYRDIKPQNIMIDHQGHLKIADFGLSKSNMKPNMLAQTFCGSPQYMAPQMLKKTGHSFSVDYYCVGALLYELVIGNPPFYSTDVDKIYYSIQNDRIEFPQSLNLSLELKMLLQQLLEKDPKRRLGSLAGIKEILAHPWVRKLDKNDVISRYKETPIKIDLLQFNVDEEGIEPDEDCFANKINSQDNYYVPIFSHFYFDRYNQACSNDKILTSVKLQDNERKKKPKLSAAKKTNSSSIQLIGKNERKRGEMNPIHISTREKQNVSSDFTRVMRSPKIAKHLVQPSKRMKDKSRAKMTSPKHKKTLERVKSSGALIPTASRRM